jgi:SAM-dependent methyltransferase
VNQFLPPILQRINRKLRKAVVYPQYRQYVAGIGPDHALAGLPTRLIGDVAEDPTEQISHYDAYAYWTAKKIAARGTGRLRILDVGSPKMMNCILSASHDLTSLVLADCGDRLSGVRYITHDVSHRLPFDPGTFDVFTSSVALPLFGLGRYGDKLDPNCLVNLVAELSRVMSPDGDLVVSMSLGRNVLNFNNSWFFDLATIKRLFAGWDVKDYLVDRASGTNRAKVEAGSRFTRDATVEHLQIGQFRVIFLHLRRSVVFSPVAS